MSNQTVASFPVNIVLNGREHGVPMYPASFMVTPQQLGFDNGEPSGSLELSLNQLKLRGLQKVEEECVTIKIKQGPDDTLRVIEIPIPAGNYRTLENYVTVMNRLLETHLTFQYYHGAAGKRLMLKVTREMNYETYEATFSTKLWLKLGFNAPDEHKNSITVCLLPWKRSDDFGSFENLIYADQSLKTLNSPEDCGHGCNIIVAESKPNLTSTLMELEVALCDVTNSQNDHNYEPVVLANIVLDTYFWEDMTKNQVIVVKNQGWLPASLTFQRGHMYEILLRDAVKQPFPICAAFSKLVLECRRTSTE